MPANILLALQLGEMKNRLILMVVVGLTGVLLSSSGIAGPSNGFHAVLDDGSDRFETTFDSNSNLRLTLTRTTVEKMNYDGPEGYTAILLRAQGVPGPGIRRDELTIFVSGQYRLLGYATESGLIYCYKVIQHGAGTIISHIAVFGPGNEDMTAVGPKGRYQYVSLSPNGTMCVLVDTGIVITDFASGSSQKVSLDEEISPHAANPPWQTEGGFHHPSGYNLSGEYLKMHWKSAFEGVLFVSGPEGTTTREIPVSWKPERLTNKDRLRAAAILSCC